MIHIVGSMVLGKGHIESFTFCCAIFIRKKAWVKNLRPKVCKNERNGLYKEICMLMDAESEIKFEENYNIFKEDYGHIAIVMRYVDVSWIGQNCYWRRIWIKFRRLFSHGFVDTTILVE